MQLDPVNIQGLHNLCVVYVERGLLSKAQACLNDAHKLAPHEDYIVKHLQIIDTRLTKLRAQPGTNQEKQLAFAEFDPRDFGGRAVKSDKISLNAQSKSSETNIEQSKTVQASKDPVFWEANTAESLQKLESFNRMQHNYATDLDDPSSGMS